MRDDTLNRVLLSNQRKLYIECAHSSSLMSDRQRSAHSLLFINETNHNRERTRQLSGKLYIRSTTA